MVRVKICGISREEDIIYVNKYLPDYIGFVFAKSKRQVSPVKAMMLIEKTDERVKKTGVFVNEEADEVLRITKECRLNAVQLHGDESPSYVSRLKKYCDASSSTEVWKAIRIKSTDSITAMKEYNADCFVLDAYSENSYGGEGKTFEWSLAKRAKKYGRIMLAGGLNPQNILMAIDTVCPFAVDASSGLETNGVKDETKIGDFIYLARYGSIKEKLMEAIE